MALRGVTQWAQPSLDSEQPLLSKLVADLSCPQTGEFVSDQASEQVLMRVLQGHLQNICSIHGKQAQFAFALACLKNEVDSSIRLYCSGDSSFMCLCSADASGEIRWMLNLYVNFNIEAILCLKNMINSSISFLIGCWRLSLWGNKIISECLLPQTSILVDT